MENQIQSSLDYPPPLGLIRTLADNEGEIKHKNIMKFELL